MRTMTKKQRLAKNARDRARRAAKKASLRIPAPQSTARPPASYLTAEEVAAAWARADRVLSPTRDAKPAAPIYFAPVKTVSGFHGRQALVTGAGIPLDAAIIRAWKAAS